MENNILQPSSCDRRCNHLCGSRLFPGLLEERGIFGSQILQSNIAISLFVANPVSFQLETFDPVCAKN